MLYSQLQMKWTNLFKTTTTTTTLPQQLIKKTFKMVAVVTHINATFHASRTGCITEILAMQLQHCDPIPCLQGPLKTGDRVKCFSNQRLGMQGSCSLKLDSANTDSETSLLSANTFGFPEKCKKSLTRKRRLAGDRLAENHETT